MVFLLPALCLTNATRLDHWRVYTMTTEAKAIIPSLETPTVVLKRPSYTNSYSSRRRAGRRVLITVCVHGNEQCGWLALQQLARTKYFNDFWTNHPGIDSLTMVLANPEATRANRRFIDTNLNRIFGAVQEEDDDTGYEYSLLKNLQNQIDLCDWYLDLHSTSAQTEPFAIPLDSNAGSQSVAECIPVTFVLEDLLESLEGTTMHWARRDTKRIAVVVECGQHQCPTAVSTAKACIEEFIKLASFFSDKDLIQPPEPSEQAIVLTCHDCQPVHHGFRYILADTPKPFSHVQYNELIAVDDVVGEIRCHFTEGAYLIMPTAHSIVGEEAWFWGRPKTQKDAASLHGRRNTKIGQR
jgi:hypothetical protein